MTDKEKKWLEQIQTRNDKIDEKTALVLMSVFESVSVKTEEMILKYLENIKPNTINRDMANLLTDMLDEVPIISDAALKECGFYSEQAFRGEDDDIYSVTVACGLKQLKYPTMQIKKDVFETYPTKLKDKDTLAAVVRRAGTKKNPKRRSKTGEQRVRDVAKAMGVNYVYDKAKSVNENLKAVTKGEFGEHEIFNEAMRQIGWAEQDISNLTYDESKSIEDNIEEALSNKRNASLCYNKVKGNSMENLAENMEDIVVSCKVCGNIILAGEEESLDEVYCIDCGNNEWQRLGKMVYDEAVEESGEELGEENLDDVTGAKEPYDTLLANRGSAVYSINIYSSNLDKLSEFCNIYLSTCKNAKDEGKGRHPEYGNYRTVGGLSSGDVMHLKEMSKSYDDISIHLNSKVGD